jgi:sarcosine oxidase subunit alpha
MSAKFRRLGRGGRLDRSKPVYFNYDGQHLGGLAGDTLASALLANDVVLVGRSFKYHRPRGIYSAGVEEPNALFTLGEGGRRTPNIPGTLVELVDGLAVRPQNAWPSVDLDVMEMNALAAPVLPAGFYYKTFMGPLRGSWMWYEPAIRKAAGLGIAGTERDPDRYDTRHEFTDVLVVGAGPAGLAAALGAGRAGARVVLVEQDTLLGGSLLSDPIDGPAAAWLEPIVRELESLPNVDIRLRTSAFGLYDGNTVGLIERRDHLVPSPELGQPRQVFITLRARSIVFATGAIERPLVFNDNDRPGVMLASAARTYLNRFAVAPATSAVIATNNDSAYRTAFDLKAADLAVTVADLRSSVADVLRSRCKDASVDLLAGTAVVGTIGRNRVVGALLAEHRPEAGAPKVTLETRPADIIAVSGGWSPVVHLTSHRGIKPVFREEIAAFVPWGFAQRQSGAGALMGTIPVTLAIAEGWSAGAVAAHECGRDRDIGPAPTAPDLGEPAGYGIAPFWRIEGLRKGKAFVDLQNDVTVHDIDLAYREGYRSVEHLKRYTTLGMGTDQGKTSNINALAIMAGLREIGLPEAGTTTFRPPYTPVALGALAGRSIGEHFRPVRRSPLHDWHAANGGEFIEAGPWLRAWWYRRAGDTAEQAYAREMRHVREAVGIADVSTLGKIDVWGPGATELLNRVYVNRFAKLPIGKARYGVMLYDDGIVYDDGTTTRLADDRYFMTTTTAMAGEVMSWLEFLLQTAWIDLEVHLTSLTDEWAGMAVSGPKSREALKLAIPGVDVSNEALPFMGSLEHSLDGVPIRILRLSFSGELAYEIYTPSNFGISLWEHVLAAARPLDIRPYGLEALASLRIEKGHVAGLDLDHRNTLYDLGLGAMAAKEKAYVGKELLERPSHVARDRWSLIGLECLEPDKRLRGGAILFAAGEELKGHGRGYITGVTWSNELNTYIALALYQGGLARAGEEIVCAFPLKDETVRARIVPH